LVRRRISSASCCNWHSDAVFDDERHDDVACLIGFTFDWCIYSAQRRAEETEVKMNDEEQRTFLSDLNKAQTALMITLIALAFLALCGGFFFMMYLILKITGCL